MTCSVFMECADKSGVLEWDTESDRIVTLHENIVGTISGPPSGDRIIVTNYDNSSATVLATQGALAVPMPDVYN